MVRVKRGWVTDTSIDVSAFELEHAESETHPLQTPPVIHISRLTSRN